MSKRVLVLALTVILCFSMVSPAMAAIGTEGMEAQDFAAEVNGEENASQDLETDADEPVPGNEPDQPPVEAEKELPVRADEEPSEDLAPLGEADGLATVTEVKVVPSKAVVIKGKSRSFEADVIGTGDISQGVVWTLANNKSAGTKITAAGVLTVAADESAQSVEVIATSVTDGAISGKSDVSVEAVPENIATELPEENYTASSFHINAPGTVKCEPKYAFDGLKPASGVTNIWTPRSIGGNDPDPWIQVDFGEKKTYNVVKVFDRNNAGSRYTSLTVQISDDGTTWQDVQTFTFNPSDTEKICRLDTPVQNQYMRLGKQETSVEGAFTHLLEIEVYHMPGTEESEGYVKSIDVAPGKLWMDGGENHGFTATVHGIGKYSEEIVWTIVGAEQTGTEIDAEGLLTVAENETAEMLTVKATSEDESDKFGTAEVVVNQLEIAPKRSFLFPAEQETFSAALDGTAVDVDWEVMGATELETAIDGNGLLTIASNERGGTLTVLATLQSDSTKMGTATVSIVDAAHNLALDRNYSASNASGSNTVGNVFDGNVNSRWIPVSSEGVEANHSWIQIDFGEAERFNTLKLYESVKRVYRMTVKVSDDGNDWEKIEDIGFEAPKKGAATAPKIANLCSSVTARYLRLEFGITNAFPSISEIEIYLEPREDLPVAFLNLKLQRTADNAVQLNWDAAEGAVGYNIYKDGVKLNTTPTAETTYTTDGGLTDNQVHAFKVMAVSAQGNEYGKENATKIGFTVKKSTENGLDSLADKNLKMPVSDMATSIEYLGPMLTDPNYHFWCISPVQGDDGKTHVFVSRWESGLDFVPNWKYESEIAHYVGDSPEGPFEEVGVVFSEENLSPYGQHAPHNPRIKKVDDTYVLLYMAWEGGANWQSNSQRVCMATSNSPYGPWEFAGRDGIIIEHAQKANNPDILKVDGEYIIYYKTDDAQGTSLYHATSDSLTGPYEKQGKAMNNTGTTEDGSAFQWKGKNFLMTYDLGNKMTGGGMVGMLWVSDDGKFYDLEDVQISYGLFSDYVKRPDGSNYAYSQSDRMERPCVFMVDGEPAYIYGANSLSVDGLGASQNYMYKIHPLPEHDITVDAAMTHGTIELSKNKAQQYDDIEFSIKPEPGYAVVADSVKVNNGKVKIKDSKFMMPAGDAEITAEFEPGTDPFVAVTDITGIPTSATTGIGLTLTGTVVPSDATERDIEWSVSDAGTTGATLANKVLSTTAAGTVKVTATIADGTAIDTDFAKSVSIVVRDKDSGGVTPPIPVYVALTFNAGEHGVLDNNQKTTTVLIESGQAWGSVAVPKATANEGFEFTGWTPKLKDTTVITNAATYTAQYKETQKTTVKLHTNAAAIRAGRTATLTAALDGKEASKGVTWTSSDPSIVAIRDNTTDILGRIEMLKVGRATITATTADGETATCVVTVLPKTRQTTVKLHTSAAAIRAKRTATLTATLDGKKASKGVTWTSSDPSIVAIRDNATGTLGRIEMLKVGTATIAATTADGEIAACVVTVLPKIQQTTVRLHTNKVAIRAGRTATLTAALDGKEASKGVTWTSSDPSIVAIRENATGTLGRIKLLKMGRATITATTADGEIATCVVKVS